MMSIVTYFYDKDGTTVMYSYLLPYGSVVTLPEEPAKTGYTFIGWSGYTDGMTVTGDISIYSSWSHNGSHDYSEIIWVAPTCTEQGYNKHICSICGGRVFFIPYPVPPLIILSAFGYQSISFEYVSSKTLLWYTIS